MNEFRLYPMFSCGVVEWITKKTYFGEKVIKPIQGDFCWCKTYDKWEQIEGHSKTNLSTDLEQTRKIDGDYSREY